MKKKAVIYKKNKLLKVYEGAQKGSGAKLFLFTSPKNFRKNLDEAEQAVAKQKTKKKKNLNIIFFMFNIVVIVVILGIQIAQSEDMSISTLVNSTFSLKIFLFIIFYWFIMQFLEAFRTNILIKQATGKHRFFLAFKTNAYGRYYDSITPMATGGQPFQILYLTHRGLSASSAISVPIGRYVVNQIVLSILWTIVMISSFTTNLGANYAFIRPLSVLGWVLNFLLMTLVVLLSVNQRIGKKLVVWCLKFLQKIKIVKNYEKQYNRVLKIVTDFQVTIKNYAKNKGTFIFLLISNAIVLLMNYSFPFLVYSCLIGFFDFSMYIELLMLTVLIDMAASFVPLPGGTGVNELSFTTLFAVVFVNSVMLTWALLIWRLMTYYIYILQGIFVMAYDNVWGNRKYLWLKKKWELEAESMNFAEEKLHEFTPQKHKKKTEIV